MYQRTNSTRMLSIRSGPQTNETLWSAQQMPLALQRREVKASGGCNVCFRLSTVHSEDTLCFTVLKTKISACIVYAISYWQLSRFTFVAGSNYLLEYDAM
jgi:hypothetical protein